VIPSSGNEVYVLVQELTSGFSQDYSVVKHEVTGTSGIQKNETLRNPVIYPNPSSGNFTMSFESMKSGGTLQIYSLSGQLIHSQPVAGNRTTMNLPTAGIYFAELINEEGIRSYCKILVQQ
jgi:hypothetical protein